MQKTDLAELRRLWGEATKGEWVAPDAGDDCLYASAEMLEQRRPLAHFVRLPNRKFIAAAHNALPALIDELEAAREELRQLRGKVEVMEGEARQHFSDLKHTEFERDECLQESEKLAANIEFLRAEMTDIHAGLCSARDADPGMEWAELVQAAESCESVLASMADMSSGLDARDRRMKAIGAAEELERLASVNQHRMLDCNDLAERAAKLRQEAEK